MNSLRLLRARGFALPMVVIMIALVFAFSSIALNASLSGRRAARAFQGTLAASQVADAGVSQAMACLNGTDGTKCGGTAGINYAGQSNVSFGGGTFTTTVTGNATAKTIKSVGAADGGKRTVTVDITIIPPTDSTSFSYALQSGEGGAHLENNSAISGTIYTNGDVDCQSTKAAVTGDAYSSKSGGKIDSCTVNFHAHADNVTNDKVGGNAYYKTSVAGSTVTGTKYANQTTPATGTLPAVDLDFWRDSAAAGGTHSGSYTPADNSTIGPLKIDGDLILDQNVDVTLAGPLWVTGNITTYNNSSITLASSFGSYSTAVLADDQANLATHGKITVVNNTGIFGSGNSSSHILFVSTNTSTSDTDPALSVANNATGAVFYALNGTLRLQSNASAKSLAGYRLFLDQNAVVTYVQSEFTGQFSNSPGTSWRMLSGTWRETSS